ncbi:hypothetical protein Ocin01_18366 [Orchesella cincta]|uniref:Uncharacterized protein n=1 Tax=Orchesella cincta TaxID=48709 RepID=A0A1D2M5R6_ORCCI|nr:hypothetical protein Ocin01_18366 [Orchesella cincta]
MSTWVGCPSSLASECCLHRQEKGCGRFDKGVTPSLKSDRSRLASRALRGEHFVLLLDAESLFFTIWKLMGVKILKNSDRSQGNAPEIPKRASKVEDRVQKLD